MFPCSTWAQKPRFQLHSSLKVNWMFFSVARVAGLHSPRAVKLFSRPIKGKHWRAQPNLNAAPSEQTHSITSESVSFITVLLTAGVSAVIDPLTDVWAWFHSRVGEDDWNSRLLVGFDDCQTGDTEDISLRRTSDVNAFGCKHFGTVYGIDKAIDLANIIISSLSMVLGSLQHIGVVHLNVLMQPAAWSSEAPFSHFPSFSSFLFMDCHS